MTIYRGPSGDLRVQSRVRHMTNCDYTGTAETCDVESASSPVKADNFPGTACALHGTNAVCTV